MKEKTVIWIDDDPFSLRPFIDEFADDDFEVIIAKNLEDGKEVIEQHGEDATAVILDIMMPAEIESDFITKGGFESGLVLARWVKNRYPSLPIVGFSVSEERRIENWFNSNGAIYIKKQDCNSLEFFEQFKKAIGSPRPKRKLKTFIVHGHDDLQKLQLKNFLQNTLKLDEPVILHEQPSLGRTVIEKFESNIRNIDLVFVLMTPDDRIVHSETNDDEKRRSRQNVIFELGYFYGKLQRRSGRVVLLYKGALDIPSDISGIIYIDVSMGIEKSGEKIRKEIEHLL